MEILALHAAEIAPLAPDLARLLTAWTALPEAIRKAVAAMVDATDTRPAGRGKP